MPASGGWATRIFNSTNLRVRFRRVLRGGVGTERVLRDPYSGIMHLCIMSSMVVLFLVTAVLAIDDYLPDDQVRILVGDRYLGYSLVGDIFGLIGLLGIGMAVAHRWVRPRTAWLPSYEDKLIVGGLGLLLITGFLVEGPAHPDLGDRRQPGLVALVAGGLRGGGDLLDREHGTRCWTRTRPCGGSTWSRR